MSNESNLELYFDNYWLNATLLAKQINIVVMCHSSLPAKKYSARLDLSKDVCSPLKVF